MSNRIVLQLIDPSLPPDGALLLPELGLTVPAGGTVEVTADIAGREPFWRPSAPDDDLSFLESRTVSQGNASVLEVHDLGYGLLAQTDKWARAAVPRSPSSPSGTGPASSDGEEG